MSERMDSLWTIIRFCRWKHGLADGEMPTKAQRNSIAKQCKDGTLPAVKVCGEWRVDVSKILEGVSNVS